MSSAEVSDVCFKRPDSQYFSEALARAYNTKEATDLILSTKDGLKIEAHQVQKNYKSFCFMMKCYNTFLNN